MAISESGRDERQFIGNGADMAYQYEKVNHELLVPQIEDQLMMYMKQENIAIGEKLPSEYKLAELFGVGRSTIREAVKSLVTKGILEVKQFD